MSERVVKLPRHPQALGLARRLGQAFLHRLQTAFGACQFLTSPPLAFGESRDAEGEQLKGQVPHGNGAAPTRP